MPAQSKGNKQTRQRYCHPTADTSAIGMYSASSASLQGL
jgi:hypothetical protein